MVPQKAVYDLTDLIQYTSKYDGKIYFIPVYKDNVEGYDIMARKDLVDKYGWDMSSVKTLKDIEPMLADAKSEGLKYPWLTQKTAMFYRLYINDFDFFTADATANWVSVDKSTNEVVDTIQTDQYKEFCTLMAEWAEKGYISEDDVTKTTTDTTTQTQDWALSWWTDIPVNAEANSRYGQDVEMTPITDRWAHSTSATIVTPVAGEPENKADLYEDFNGGAKTSPAAGFCFDKSPVEAQFAARQNVFETYGFPLENGGFAAADVESTIEAYQAALDEAGYQDVLAEFQSQYDAWKAQ